MSGRVTSLDQCHTCDFVAQLCHKTLLCDKVAACNCACHTLPLCRVNKKWPSWLVIPCLCDKVAVCGHAQFTVACCNFVVR